MSSLMCWVGVGIVAVGCVACGDDGGSGGGGAGGTVKNSCEPVSGDGTRHESIAGDETWSAADSPHIVGADLLVPAGVTLTIEPCAEIRLEAERKILVEGNLVGAGKADERILFTAADSSAPWGYLEVTDPGRMAFAYTTIEGGGAIGATAFGMVDARGDQLLPAAPVLDFDHVTVRGSSAFGISLRENAGFSETSSDLTITGSAKAPLRILPRLATNVPDGDYTGNTADEIVVENEVGGNIDLEDVTFHDRGVPYQIGGETTLAELVVGPSPVTMTLMPGVVFAFNPNGRLTVDVSGQTGGIVVAEGTADKPIVFTSASAAPAGGDWIGIWVEHVDAATRFSNVEIRYAGGPSGASSFHCEPDGSFSDEDALITFFEKPDASVLTSSLLSDSPKRGVNLAYYGDTVDLLSSNTFENIAGCKLTTPRPEVGICPSSSPCP
ncbi:MAG: hypothetical protein JNL21_24210 [Myxococcales bacterium]|nr:hypothetical protein [Myxococcales bacterium]